MILVLATLPAYAAAYVFTIPGANGSAPATTLPRWGVFALAYTGIVVYVFHEIIQTLVMAVIRAWRER